MQQLKLTIQLPVLIFLIIGSSVFSALGQSHQLVEGNRAIRVSTNEKISFFVGTKVPPKSENIPPIMGSYERGNDQIIFTPRFPFRYGMTYLAANEDSLLFTFTIPTYNSGPAPQITYVYPSTDILPANLLKMYIEFTVPMQTGKSYRFFTLVDEKGDTVNIPFLELQPELWDPTNQRLTLWFDPGRVKRDLGPNQLKGTPLIDGKNYTLTISKNWRDVYGRKLLDTFEKKFHVIISDRTQPNPDSWTFTKPTIGTREPLIIHFQEPMDYAVAISSIDLLRHDYTVVSGRTELKTGEKDLYFYPQKPWQSDRYKIRFEGRLEDLAGNNLNRLFDRDLETVSKESEKQEYFFIDLPIEE